MMNQSHHASRPYIMAPLDGMKQDYEASAKLAALLCRYLKLTSASRTRTAKHVQPAGHSIKNLR